MIEVIIKVSDSERTLTQKFLADEGFIMDHSDPVLEDFVKQAIANFNGKPDDVVVKTICDW